MNVNGYLNDTQALIDSGNKSDGCTMPFSSWLHKQVNNSKLICTAHDFGSRGLIEGVKPGWHNNTMFLKANWQHGNYIWGTLSFTATLPYALVRYNLGWKIGVVPFHALIVFTLVVGGLYQLSAKDEQTHETTITTAG